MSAYISKLGDLEGTDIPLGIGNALGLLLLHCVRPAMSGGENAIIDKELVYILMREDNPEYIRALIAEDTVLYPENVIDGVQLRPDRMGPVWMLAADGHLHMRYTMRKRNVLWKDDADTAKSLTLARPLLRSH